MKKGLKILVSVVPVALLMAMLVACGNSPKATDITLEAPAKGESEILVAYFSWSGHLQQMAGWVAEESGGELFRRLPFRSRRQCVGLGKNREGLGQRSWLELK